MEIFSGLYLTSHMYHWRFKHNTTDWGSDAVDPHLLFIHFYSLECSFCLKKKFMLKAKGVLNYFWILENRWNLENKATGWWLTEGSKLPHQIIITGRRACEEEGKNQKKNALFAIFLHANGYSPTSEIGLFSWQWLAVCQQPS